MKTFRFACLVACILIVSAAVHALAQGTAFTYQGLLNDNDDRASGT